MLWAWHSAVVVVVVAVVVKVEVNVEPPLTSKTNAASTVMEKKAALIMFSFVGMCKDLFSNDKNMYPTVGKQIWLVSAV
jgi:hypothetical protein